ncbi:hypothetical protein [Thiomicrorhabdus lithotrophica]|uniref:Uncharacterized protein n=1 Tax=Thiomicrorhabdus lithotrophica TaxID=2949997 RepID=A0ABY8C7D4_9GAMM|nr:hypothetical protein [Thiomicrorhabdus lithotrophica]WEJ61869.1 hypothetical protein NR989_07555 [Thiomicrorhabdus lithotrophica]
MTIEANQTENTEPDTLPEEQHPIKVVINSFVHKILDIHECAATFIPMAAIEHNQNIENIESALEKASKHFEDSDQQIKLSAIKDIREVDRKAKRIINSNLTETLEKSLYVNIFSAFDQFTGDLISILYHKKPELFNSINKEIKLSEALQFNSLDELRMVVLEKEIETLKRKSYSEQFKEMEKMFSVSLTKFEDWPHFIENSQRRNLFTHCDGIVSEQYIQICKDIGAPLIKDLSVGSQLEIGASYFNDACERITEVAVMLAQTLWRKMFPEEIEIADNQLHELIFDFLHMEYWGLSIKLSKFATTLPNISSEQINRINIVNYAIALYGSDRKQEAISLLNKTDWSASTYDFKLAFAVLTDDYQESRKLMLLIGKQGELISELSYIDWPLFKYFRENKYFLETYEEIYGYPYISKALKEAEKTKEEAQTVNNS